MGLLTTKEVAARLGVSRGTIIRWVSERIIPHIRLGRTLRFDPNDIENWLLKKNDHPGEDAKSSGMF